MGDAITIALSVLVMAQCAVMVHLVWQHRKREQEASERLTKLLKEYTSTSTDRTWRSPSRQVRSFEHPTWEGEPAAIRPSVRDLAKRLGWIPQEEKQSSCIVSRVSSNPEKLAFITDSCRSYVSAVDLEQVIRTKSDNGELKYEMYNGEPHVSLPMGEERAYAPIASLLPLVPGVAFTEEEISDWAEGLNPEMFDDK